jgi:WD40 repeat protein
MIGPILAALLLAQDLPQRSLVAHAENTTQVRSAAEGKILVTTGVPDRTVKVWLVSTGKVLHTLGQQVQCMSLRPDGGLVAVGEETRTTVWNLTTGKNVHTLETGRTVALGWSADGKALTTVGLTAEKDGVAGVLEARIWDLPAAESRKPVLIPLSKIPASLAVSPGGTMLALTHWEGGLRTWDLPKDRVDLQIPGKPLTQVAWSPSGRMLAYSSGDREVEFILSADGKPLKRLAGSRIAFSPDGMLVGLSSDAGIDLYKTDTWMRLEATYGGPGTGVWIPEAFDFTADGRWLIAGGTLVAKDGAVTGRLSGAVYSWKVRR